MYVKILELHTMAVVEPYLSEANGRMHRYYFCTMPIIQENIWIPAAAPTGLYRPRESSWKSMMPGQLLDSIRAIHASSKSMVRTQSGLTSWFKVTNGIWQGCILLLVLFIIYMDQITKAANPKPEDLNKLFDGQCVVNNDMVQLQDHMECLSSCCENYDMRISTTKTEVFSIGCTIGKLSISIGKKYLHQTVEYKYLGSIFSENGKMNREIRVRIQRANSVIYQLLTLMQHWNIPMETNAKVISSIFLPPLTYQCQTWTLNRDLERKVTTCKMKCLRRTTGKTGLDKIRNKETLAVVRTSAIMSYIVQ